VTFPSTLQLLVIFFATAFKDLKVVRIYNTIWVRTPYSLIYGYEYFGTVFWMSSQAVKL